MTDQLTDLVAEIERAAGRLRSGGLAPDEAGELVERCAELGGQLAAELDSRGRAAAEAEGQERLL